MKMTSSSKLTWLISTIFLIVCVSAISATNCGNDPDFRKNTFELIANKNYPVENYTITTSDNYVLNIFRIPNGNGYKGNNTKKPIMLLAHGLIASSSDWVLNFPNQSLGFMGYDNDYDVWLLNFRGNTYSNTNTKISNLLPKFWKFSYDQLALIDLPATIDFILNETSQSELFYVGHSMGTTTILALLANKIEYQQKVKKVALLAPLATTYYSKLVKFAAPLKDLIPAASIATSGVYGELLPSSLALDLFVKLFCTANFDPICKLVAAITGSSGAEFNSSRLCVYMSTFPAGSSAYTLVQYLQGADAQVFKMYDYGSLVNQHEYGMATPPIYDINRIKTPIGLYSSIFDEFINQTDVDFIRRNLGTPPPDDFVVTDIPSFKHVAFVRGLNASKVIYSRVLALFSSP